MGDEFTMKCNKCNAIFPERLIQSSHDVPKYVGGTDKDGRHYLCQKCHDIYEKIVFSMMVKDLPETEKIKLREKAKQFAKRYFND